MTWLNHKEIAAKAIAKGLPHCTCKYHQSNSLYPVSIYKCAVCGTLHTTFCYGGAIAWQCPKTLIRNSEYHAIGNDVYIGSLCGMCGDFIPKQD